MYKGIFLESKMNLTRKSLPWVILYLAIQLHTNETYSRTK